MRLTPKVWQLTNDGDIVSRSLEFPKGDVDGDTTLTLSLQLVEHPCVLEGTLAQLGSFLQRTLARYTQDDG